MFESKAEQQAFEAEVQRRVEAGIAARMAELQFGQQGPLKRATIAIGRKVDVLAGQSKQMDQQLGSLMQELDRMIKGWEKSASMSPAAKKGKRPDVSRDLRKGKQHLDKAAGNLGQLVEELFDAASALG